jgi:hypothetical protein
MEKPDFAERREESELLAAVAIKAAQDELASVVSERFSN